MALTLDEIAALVGGRVAGEGGGRRITGVAGLAEAGPGDLAFLANARYAAALPATRAGAVLLGEADVPLCPCPAVVVDAPDWAFSVIAERFGPPSVAPPPGVHPLAHCDAAARIGTGAAVGPFAVVGAGAEIGDGTILHAQVYVGPGSVLGVRCVLHPGVIVRERVRIGDRVILHPGVVVGADGFGFATVRGEHRKIPQLGTVVIEDDVEIGANSTVDRARFGVTRIGRGTKIDNLVQIGHNVDIGERSLIAAQVGLAGSAKLGKGVRMGGQSGMAGHLELGDGAQVAAAAGVTKNHPPGAILNGIPGRPIAQYTRAQAALQRLPALIEEVRGLRRTVAELAGAKKKQQSGRSAAATGRKNRRAGSGGRGQKVGGKSKR